ncbi:MAG: NAD+ synthase [Firmicutes bacterium]|nr:NAD+ synthase [Alicyclobacillaceae bacterium]MCL6498191.1 NAD+ synthase [Bacillota bacterium]
MRVALVQVNPTVGDVAGNAALVREGMRKARAAGAQVAVFPELVLPGYPPEDLLFRPAFIDRVERVAAELAAESQGLLAVFGFVYSREALYNGAAVALDGRWVTTVAKQYLPNYGVFDEARYFSRGQETTVLEWGRWRIGISICEDIWYPDGPHLAQARAGANLLINISASPYARGKGAQRERMIATRADDASAHLVWVNLVGAQDELVFDGRSAAFDPQGRLLARAPSFAEAFLTVDLPYAQMRHRRWVDPRWRQGVLALPVHCLPLGPGPAAAGPPTDPAPVHPAPDEAEELFLALVSGVRDYIGKNRFGDVVVGLSGGIDSALTAAIAKEALGPERVHGVLMPSAITSEESRRDAIEVCRRLGIDWLEIPIAPIFDAFLSALGPVFQDLPWDLTEENLQARIRGTLLMALSNKFGWLVLTTGNKSEMATGYSTLYGDMAGGFAVLKDVLKTDVFRLARWLNQHRDPPPIPEAILVKPPSAELRPGQKDEDSLPPYAILDQVLQGYVEEDLTPDALIAAGLPAEHVERAVTLVDRNEYKRRQAPVGIKVTPRAFGRDRRMPITHRDS